MAFNFPRAAENLYRRQVTANRVQPLASVLVQGLANIWLPDKTQQKIRREELEEVNKSMNLKLERQ